MIAYHETPMFRPPISEIARAQVARDTAAAPVVR
jgi:hypothetical protein